MEEKNWKVGDAVWVMLDNKLKSRLIYQITMAGSWATDEGVICTCVLVEKGDDISFFNPKESIAYYEEDLFETKEELIKSLY